MQRNPLPSSPIRSDSGTRMPSNQISFESTALRPIFSISRTRAASRSRSVKNRLSPSVGASSRRGAVRASSMILPETWAVEVQIFWPRKT